MFQKAKNIDAAFKHIRSFTFVALISSAFFCCFTLYKSLKSVEAAQSRVYILESGKILEAYASPRGENVEVEARDHIASFHRLFFTLDPDDKSIQSALAKALYLADGSAKKQYDDLRESGYYTGIISGNISQQIQIDSITVKTSTYPYSFQCSAVQRIIRPTSIVTRKLLTEGTLRTVSRSDNNPHGFLIEKWITLENKDIGVQNR
ncbi:conjugative transposon protein TraK [Dyadobacter subterraneus]|uniref:Conjugative transposon protein TraK n=1 Tax=Dyadobacter subterraneus TaxID=2773304 RepID=A0ABR9W9A5_9BACT|nr:conjugative transposon protein TraK [Dyadobacter subterraneus]MBE9462067.1 conjugative transposon protein TraK [Dyadobacter subterraneus]